MNVTAPLWSDNRFEQEMKQQTAELYARIYAIAAEDFTSQPDIKKYVDTMTICLQNLQEQLTSLFNIISKHTHRVPAHTHPMEPHTHPTPEGTSGPNIGAHSTLPTLLMTESPVEGGSIAFSSLTIPEFINTSGAIPNLEGNRIVVGPSRVGPLIVGPRRLKEDPSLTSISLAPLVQSLKSF